MSRGIQENCPHLNFSEGKEIFKSSLDGCWFADFFLRLFISFLGAIPSVHKGRLVLLQSRATSISHLSLFSLQWDFTKKKNLSPPILYSLSFLDFKRSENSLASTLHVHFLRQKDFDIEISFISTSLGWSIWTVQWINRKKTYKLDFPLSSVIRKVYLFFEQTKKRKNSVQPSKPVYTAPATLWLWPLDCFESWWDGWNIAKDTSSPRIFIICARTLLHVGILMQMVLTNSPKTEFREFHVGPLEYFDTHWPIYPLLHCSNKPSTKCSHFNISQSLRRNILVAM